MITFNEYTNGDFKRCVANKNEKNTTSLRDCSPLSWEVLGQQSIASKQMLQLDKGDKEDELYHDHMQSTKHWKVFDLFELLEKNPDYNKAAGSVCCLQVTPETCHFGRSQLSRRNKKDRESNIFAHNEDLCEKHYKAMIEYKNKYMKFRNFGSKNNPKFMWIPDWSLDRKPEPVPEPVVERRRAYQTNKVISADDIYELANVSELLLSAYEAYEQSNDIEPLLSAYEQYELVRFRQRRRRQRLAEIESIKKELEQYKGT